jgi:hypothetical protein
MRPEKSVPTKDADRRVALFSICAMLVPILFFYIALARHLINIPFGDDYNGVLDFLERFSDLQTTFAKLGYILNAQHNEYKTIFANFIIALQYKLFSHPDFVVLSWLGNLFVLPLFYIAWRHFLPREENLSRRLLLFVPVSFLLFQLQYAETLNWSMPGLQNIPVLVFAFACIAFLAKEDSRSFLIACTFLVLTIASSGNGFALFPIGIAMLIGRKQASRVVIWIAVVAACGALYFYHYDFLSSQQVRNGSVLQSAHYLNPIFALSFMGAAAGNNIHLVRVSSIFLGMAIVGVIVLMSKDRYYKMNPTIFYFVSFLVLTAIAVSGIRSKLGFHASSAGRYKIYSDLFLICCYAFLVERYGDSLTPVRQRRYFQVALVCSVLFCAGFDIYGIRYLAARQSDMVSGVKLYESSNHQRGPVVFNGDDSSAIAVELNRYFHPMIQKAESTGLYRFP